MMTPEDRPTAADLSGNVGKGGVTCPRCGCRHMEAYRTEQPESMTYRYRRCRNCSHRVYTRQSPEEIVRDVVPRIDEHSSFGVIALTDEEPVE